MDALSFNLCFDTTSLAHRDAFRGERHPPHLEALTVIFRDLIMGERFPSMKYRIAYQIGDHWVFIDADPERSQEPYRAKTIAIDEQPGPFEVGANFETIGGTTISRTKLVGEDSQYLPKFLFGYYSGESRRMSELFLAYLERYDKKLRAGEDPGTKRMFFAEPVHSNFVLLSFIVNNTDRTNAGFGNSGTSISVIPGHAFR